MAPIAPIKLALTVLCLALTVLYLALTVLYIALTVLYIALTVLYLALTVLYLALTVLYVSGLDCLICSHLGGVALRGAGTEAENSNSSNGSNGANGSNSGHGRGPRQFLRHQRRLSGSEGDLRRASASLWCGGNRFEVWGLG